MAGIVLTCSIPLRHCQSPNDCTKQQQWKRSSLEREPRNIADPCGGEFLVQTESDAVVEGESEEETVRLEQVVTNGEDQTTHQCTRHGKAEKASYRRRGSCNIHYSCLQNGLLAGLP